MKLASIMLTVSFVLAATPALAQDEAPEPLRYPPFSVRPKLIGGGLAITAVAYGVGFVAATSWPDAPGVESLKIPVVGPWMALAENKCKTPGSDNCSNEVWLRGILTGIGGMAQLAGLGLIVEGIVMKTEAAAAKPAPSTETTETTETTSFVMPYPILTPTSVGVGLVGSF